MNISISDAIFNDCVNNKLKTVKIYNGIDLKKWECTGRGGEEDGTAAFNIINIARITHQKKGQDVLIKALKECKSRGMEFACSFVGGVYEYDEKSFEYLKKLTEDLELTREVTFLGNRGDILQLLAKADLFILPSRYEGLPISLLEAMAAKVPVVASNIDGSAELIEHNKNGWLFESQNHLDLADKIFFLYHNREKMDTLAQSAYEYVQGLDISIMYKKYCELYESLS